MHKCRSTADNNQSKQPLTVIPTTTIATTDSIAYRNFVNTCTSAKTRKDYERSLHYYISYLSLELNKLKDQSLYDYLAQQDPKIIQINICDYITYLRKHKNLSSKSIATYVSGVRKFYAMNDVTSLNWEKIHKFEPEDERRYEDRPYTREELKKLLDKTNQRNRAIILLLSSSGCRVGVIPTLRIRDLVPIDKYQIYKVIAYAKSNKSRYYTFCSPEARKEIDDYLAWRKRWNEKLTDDSPVFRQEFNLQKDSRVQNPKPLTVNSIGFIMNKLLKQTGIRQVQPLIAGQYCGPRTEIQQLHGTRKYFETTAFKAGM